MDYLTTHTSLSPIRRGFAPGFVNYQKRCTRLTTASDEVYQLLAHGGWFSPASSTTKTGRHDIAEILLKVALKHQQSKSSNHSLCSVLTILAYIKCYLDFLYLSYLIFVNNRCLLYLFFFTLFFYLAIDQHLTTSRKGSS